MMLYDKGRPKDENLNAFWVSEPLDADPVAGNVHEHLILCFDTMLD